MIETAQQYQAACREASRVAGDLELLVALCDRMRSHLEAVENEMQEYETRVARPRRAAPSGER